jgi:hypothetical protein
MIDKFYRTKDAIIAALTSQSFDDSIFSKSDWAVPKELLDFFGLFVKTATIMQADNSQLSIELSLNTSASSVD